MLSESTNSRFRSSSRTIDNIYFFKNLYLWAEPIIYAYWIIVSFLCISPSCAMRPTLGPVSVLPPPLSLISSTYDICDDQSEFDDCRSYTELEAPTNGTQFDCCETDDCSSLWGLHLGIVPLTCSAATSGGLYHSSRDPMFAGNQRVYAAK